MISLGIMQGRLSKRNYEKNYQYFPKETWKNEFTIAKKLNLNHIELVYDVSCNILNNKENLNELYNLGMHNNIQIVSICADFFQYNTLFDKEHKYALLSKFELAELIRKCHFAVINNIILPFVDDSSLNNDNKIVRTKKYIDECLYLAQIYGININLELDKSPKEVLKLIKYLDNPCIKINYDTGNSTSLGFNPEEEFKTYREYIATVHIKDRKVNGKSVPYGTGDTDFKTIFKLLKNSNFNGPITLQLARPENGEDDVEFFKQQYNKFKADWEKYYIND